jgi:Cu/Ag efflux pump CusA
MAQKIERPFALIMMGGLLASNLLTLLCIAAHQIKES